MPNYLITRDRFISADDHNTQYRYIDCVHVGFRNLTLTAVEKTHTEFIHFDVSVRRGLPEAVVRGAWKVLALKGRGFIKSNPDINLMKLKED